MINHTYNIDNAKEKIMKKYTIELDETIAEFLEKLSDEYEQPIENIISDTIFNQVDKIINLKKSTFSFNSQE